MKKITDIEYGEHKDNKLDIYLPESNKFSVFVYFHGGGIESGDKLDTECLAEYLTQRNIAFVSANYRMYPAAVYPEFIRDAAASVGWVNENIHKYGELDKFYVGGTSAGGYIAMMLCFDSKYLAPYGIEPTNLNGFFFDAGQPTSHFNVCRERGFDPRRVIVDETAPLYYIGTAKEYPPMHFVVSDNDMECRYEQTMLILATLKHFEYDSKKYSFTCMKGTHCEYLSQNDENGNNVLATLIYKFIEKCEKNNFN